MTEIRKGLRRLLAQPGIVVAPGAYDCLSARIIERAGFPAVYMTGYGISASFLGRPDVGLLTMTEMAGAAGRMAAAVSIPVIADADTGYGNPINVTRTVQEYERAGVAALHIEDQTWPKRCGNMEGKQVIPKEEMVQKVRAAVKARQDGDLVIIARTDAIAVNGLEDALERGRAYAKAGADVIFVEAPRNLEDVRAIAASIEAPLLFNRTASGKAPPLSVAELEALGFKMVIFPTHALYAVSRTVAALMEEIKRTGSVAPSPDRLPSFDEFNDLIGLPEIRELEREFGVS